MGALSRPREALRPCHPAVATAYSTAVKTVPSLAATMTPFPYSIDASASLAEATRMIAEHDFHHLPVTDDGELVGVISQRDILVAETLAPGELSVADIKASDPYVVDLKTPLLEVVRHMAERSFEAALVTRQDKLVGIVTTTDLARILAQVLAAKFPSGPEAPEIA